MRVLVVGAGAREHALAWHIAASPLTTKLWVAPGNPGTAALAENVPIEADAVEDLAAFAQRNHVDLVVPGPEAPLVAGLADAMADAGIRCCGPSRAAAALEGSKAFAKQLCDDAGIPTARWERFTDADAAIDFVTRRGAPVVVKADGLAGGKGVVVAETEPDAIAAIHAIITQARHGPQGRALVLEEKLEGPECSLFALCDGTDAVFLGLAQDHKRLHDGNTGPNTGGMGAFAPIPAPNASTPDGPTPDDPILDGAALMDAFIRPALATMAARGTPFRGILFAGLMLTAAGPRLIEYNVRFGDPECQALLPLLRSDLLPALLAACDGELRNIDLRWAPGACVAITLATRGYPDAPDTEPGDANLIDGLEAASATPGALIFEAATRLQNGRLIAAGGRVLTVCGTGPNLPTARTTAYAAVNKIHWPNATYRHDIATTP